MNNTLGKISELNQKLMLLERLRYECKVLMKSHPPVRDYTKISSPVSNHLSGIVEQLGNGFVVYKANKYMRDLAIKTFHKNYPSVPVRKSDTHLFKQRMGFEVTMLMVLNYLDTCIAHTRSQRDTFEQSFQKIKLCTFSDLK